MSQHLLEQQIALSFVTNCCACSSSSMTTIQRKQEEQKQQYKKNRNSKSITTTNTTLRILMTFTTTLLGYYGSLNRNVFLKTTTTRIGVVNAFVLRPQQQRQISPLFFEKSRITTREQQQRQYRSYFQNLEQYQQQQHPFRLHSSFTRLSSSTTNTNDEVDVSTTTAAELASDCTNYDDVNRQIGLSTKYEPQLFENNIYRWWERSGCFDPDAKYDLSGTTSSTTSTTNTMKKAPYVLPMPPPNVTGKLHMGHAMFVAVQDILARFHRMCGHPVLYLPGTDHAGIATQLQVEKLLLAEGTSRTEIGREEFLKRIYQYKDEQGNFITNQLRALGASADWNRERFTMDTTLSNAVMEAFVQLHDKQLIYKGEYLVNWAPMLQTAVSDLEVDYTDEMGKLYYFKYQLENSNEFIPVATTRPETIVGDTAVCVNPNDERYQQFIGKNVVVPLSGGRVIPVIADEYVDIEFGTGALKITPGHDPNDYTLGKKYNLPIINVMNKDGSMNQNAGTRYNGLDRFVCRTELWKDMEEAKLTIRVQENHPQRIPRSQRGGDIIEPMVSKQWFLKTENMAKQALKVVEDGEVQIIPSRFEKIWYNWLSDNRDWCISRQLWWGHRIPVWYIGSTSTTIADGGSTTNNDNNEVYVVARNEVEARVKATELGYDPNVPLLQEEDVLDTWFSSGLWPFATVGWPQDENQLKDPTSDFNRFYPASCLETGYDILFFWVARMVMMGIELTGKSPFGVVYLHGLVRASDGTKMSKTKGNVIDPIETVNEYGADSLRYSLVTGVTPGQDIPLNMDKVEANRNFANKLWNCCKFVLGSALNPETVSPEEIKQLAVTGPLTAAEFETLLLPERYIVSKLHSLIESVTEDMEQYQLGAAGGKVYEFLWDQFADWYIEISKTRLYAGAGGDNAEEAQAARRVLVYVLDCSLRLLHPYMPYVTEQLWHHLPKPPTNPVGENDKKVVNALMLADWPLMVDDNGTKQQLVTSLEAVQQFECFQALTRKIRNARAEYNVEPGKRIGAILITPPGAIHDVLQAELKSLYALTKLDPTLVSIHVSGSDEARDALADVATIQLIVQDGVECYLPLSTLIDPVKERKRLEKESEKLMKDITKLKARLESNGFTDKAPMDVVEKVRNELMELENQMNKIQTSLTTLTK